MTRKAVAGIPALFIVCMVQALAGSSRFSASMAEVAADTAYVSSPTEDRDTDRASILTALEQVQPGGIVQFAAGTYLIGEFIEVPVSRITLLGHHRGTTLRGCNPEEWSSVRNPRVSCKHAGAARQSSDGSRSHL
jgi:hypothetical protein